MLFWAGPARGLRGAQAWRLCCGIRPVSSVAWRTRVYGRAGGIARVNVIISVDYFKPPGGKKPSINSKVHNRFKG